MKTSKIDEILVYLQELDDAVLAYSGGVDSTLLLVLLKKAQKNLLAVTSVSQTYSSNQLRTAREFTLKYGVEHLIIETDEMENRDFVMNTPMRCYHCKHELFSALKREAEKRGMKNVLDASHAEDTHDYRPGLEAADVLGVISPFRELGWDKEMIRGASRMLGIDGWDRPQTVCSASRIPYGVPVTVGNIAMIERAEEYLRSLGFGVVRVRSDGVSARIELNRGEVNKILEDDLRNGIVDEFLNIGFKFVSLDLEGFKSGKMNRLIENG